MARKKSSPVRAKKDPRDMTPEELQRLQSECEGKIALIERFGNSEEWRVISTWLDGHLRGLENIGRRLRQRLGRPVAGQPPVTLEQIAAHEARIEENAIIRRLPKTILGIWREQLEQLQQIRDVAAR